MKKIYILLAILGITISSCKDDFINLRPEDETSAATFYRTEPQLRQAVTAAYVPLRSLVLDHDFIAGEMRSDNTHYQPYPANRGTDYVFRENVADFTDKADNGNTNAIYFLCYSGIARANIVIEKNAVADIPEDVKREIDGEAKFLRALYYFKLVRYFGDVPLYLSEVTTAEEAFLSRSPADEVYAQIILDAKDAVNQLNPPEFTQDGRATKGSATMLLADVYATRKNWVEAEKLLVTLDGMGYSLWSNYADAFLPGNKNKQESIFEVQFAGGTNAGSAPSNFIYKFLPRTAGSNFTDLITGTKTSNGASGGLNTPTQDMINAYEPGDTRKDASIAIAEGVYNGSDLLILSANKSIINYTPATGKVGIPYIKKYLHTPHPAPNNTHDNWPIYRYAEALLLLAESLNEQNGKQAQALIPLNKVRDRAFGVGVSPITTTDQIALRDIIAHERRVELAFENKRWHDLVRTGKAIQVMNAHGVALKQQYPWLSPDSYNVTTEKLFFPLPQSELELNPAL